MTVFRLLVDGLRRGKARFVCAIAGVAVASGVLVFITSLVATNNAQAPRVAEVACAPWGAWRLDGVQMRFGRGRPSKAEIPTPAAPRPTHGARPDLSLSAVALTIDYRPGGRVMQGPPMFALLAEAPPTNIYGAVALKEGRWINQDAAEAEVVCVRQALRRFGTAPAPALGESLKFVGRKGTMTARIVGYLDGGKLPREFPGVFANRAAIAALAGEEMGVVSFYRRTPERHAPGMLTPASESVIASFRADEQRHMDYATPLLLVAALLAAVSLLVNSLLLSIEANRSTIAALRTVGMTRTGVIGLVVLESAFAGVVGWVVGVGGALAALFVYVAADAAAFPMGMAIDFGRIRMTAIVLPFVIALASIFAIAPALRVRAMDVAQRRPHRRRSGMAVAFGCGFAAFVAVEVWGASLMRAFMPSPEWPDAIVSILPGGASSFDVEKLRTVEGVHRISELVPRQLPFADAPVAKSGEAASKWVRTPNVLFLAAEFLPRFRFVEGSWEEANQAVMDGDGVIITEMMSRAKNLHKGDSLVVRREGRRGGQAETLSFPIAGVVDLNWHMVASRGLLRGLNGAPGWADGPAFCSLDTMGVIDFRTYMTDAAMSAPMTHLWVEYDADFLKRHGVFQSGRLIEAEVFRRLGCPTVSTVRLHARDEIADGTLSHGGDVIGQIARVPFVFLAILAIGFVAMLVAEADSRRRELAVLRAVGATKWQLAASLASSAVKTAAAGIAAGIPLGALVGWLFTFKTGSFWPGLPHWFVVPWRIVAEGAIGAVVFALAFAIPTAMSLVRRATRR